MLEQDFHRISFWEIQFGDDVSEIHKNMQVFGPEERAKLTNVLKDFLEKRKEYIFAFIERVGVDVAPDYRSIIPSEMFFDLIQRRLSNGFYRSQEVSVFFNFYSNSPYFYSNCSLISI